MKVRPAANKKDRVLEKVVILFTKRNFRQPCQARSCPGNDTAIRYLLVLHP